MPNLSFMYQLSHSKVRQKPGMAEKEGCFRCGKDGHWYVVWHCQICIVVSANVCCQSKYSANILVNKIFILMNAKIYVNEFVFIFVYWLSHRGGSWPPIWAGTGCEICRTNSVSSWGGGWWDDDQFCSSTVLGRRKCQCAIPHSRILATPMYVCVGVYFCFYNLIIIQ